MTKIKVTVEIPDGKYCRESSLKQETVCNFFWESEDGDTGCCLLNESTFIEGDISQVPKFSDCSNRQLRVVKV
jgi:hypothetical protein